MFGSDGRVRVVRCLARVRNRGKPRAFGRGQSVPLVVAAAAQAEPAQQRVPLVLLLVLSRVRVLLHVSGEVGREDLAGVEERGVERGVLPAVDVARGPQRLNHVVAHLDVEAVVDWARGLWVPGEWFAARVGVQGEVRGADLDGEHALRGGTALAGREDGTVRAHPALRARRDLVLCHGCRPSSARAC